MRETLPPLCSYGQHASLDQLAGLFEIVGDFDVVIAGCGLEHGLFDVDVDFCGSKGPVILQRFFEMPEFRS
jgi:hypothetical protein